MLTDKTASDFAKANQHIDNLAAGFWTEEYIEVCRREEEKRQVGYEAHFDIVMATLADMEPAESQYACKLLKRLGEEECRSGTAEFRHTTELLEFFGIPQPNGILDHDRKFIADQYLRETDRG